uniref:Molybdopterin biosynthesis protein n=1 Tax=Ignisphaera aggregans TaxID=334771 RepID=A0A7J2U4G7_9CREN
MDKDSIVKRKVFHTLLSIEEAELKLEQLGLLKPIGEEEVELENAYGRVLAEDIFSPIDYPPFDRSEVDGYAVSIKSVEGADELHPKKLKVVGKVSIGEIPSISIAEDFTTSIDTGAIIPKGADGIIMEEYTERVTPNEVIVYKSIVPGENISFAGSDISLGELVLKKGTRITYKEIGVLAALGISRVRVFKKPKVVVVSIGNELQKPGTKLALGKIYDTNGYAITSFLKQRGFDVRYHGILPDSEEVVYNEITKLLTSFDVVITSGGTSAGEEDITYRVFERLGTILVHGLRVKPGKPTVIAISREGKILFGLPGFPFSALSVAMLLLVKVLERLEGFESRLMIARAMSTFKVRKDIGRTWFMPVILSSIGGKLFAILLQTSSGSVSALLKADGIAIIREDRDYVDEGEEIEIARLGDELKEAVIIGSHDTLLTMLLTRFGIIDRVSIGFVGSYRGLQLMRRGYIDVSPIHLLDPATGEYNIPFIEKDKELSNKAVLVRGYRRKLVLAFAKGNPKNVKGFEDILRTDIRFVNRNRGSGTRIYIDKVLEDIAKSSSQSFSKIVRNISGYWYEVSTHTGVAAAIAQGRADVGVCTEHAAMLYNLDYIPLTWEYYDFLINVHSMDKNIIKKFIEGLRNPLTKDVVNGFRGYEAPSEMGLKLCC